jgi:hypothetical protein
MGSGGHSADQCKANIHIQAEEVTVVANCSIKHVL